MPPITDIAGARAALTDATTKLVGIVDGPAAGAASEVETTAGLVKTLRRLQAEAKPVGHSTSSVTIATGNKSFTLVAGHYLPEEGEFRISSDANRANFMAGTFSSLVGLVLTVNVTSIGGEGTFADWTIRPTSERGDNGAAGAPGSSNLTRVRGCLTAATLLSAVTNGSTHDGVTYNTNDRFIRKEQTITADNGVFKVQASGDAIRDPDFDTFAKLSRAIFVVQEGTVYAGSVWECTVGPTGTIGSTSIQFARVESGKSTIDFTGRLIVERDRGVVRVPSFFKRSLESGTFGSAIAPLDGSLYTEAVVANDGNIKRIYLDLDAADAGTNPVLVVSGSTKPLNGSWKKPEIGRYRNGVFQSVHEWVGGTQARGIVRNQFREGNDPDNCSRRTSAATVVDIADADLLALGCTRGLQGVVDGFAAIGADLQTRTVGGEYLHAVIYIKTTIANTFDRPSFWLLIDDELGTRVDLTLLKVISTTVRAYLINTQVASAGATGFMIGVAPAVSPSGAQFTVGLGQFAIQRNGPVGWIRYDDYPSAPEQLLPVPLMASDVYLIEGREAVLVTDAMVQAPDPGIEYTMSLAFPTPERESVPYCLEGRGVHRIDDTRFADGAVADFRVFCTNRGRSLVYEQPVTFHKVPGTGVSKTIDMLGIGDSIMNRELLEITKEIVEETGATCNNLGTINTSSSSTPSATGGPLGEAREGRGWGELVNRSISREGRPVPLVPGDEATYMALPKTDSVLLNSKVGYNPFLFPEASYPSLPAINGQVFNFGAYLTRFTPNIAVPTHVPAMLGFNEASYFSRTLIRDNIAEAIEIFCDSVLAADSDIKIGLGMSRPAVSTYEHDLRTKWDIAIDAIIRAQTKYGHPNVKVIPVWAHMQQTASYSLNASPAADTANGVPWRRAEYQDARHPPGVPRRQYGQAIAAWALSA